MRCGNRFKRLFEGFTVINISSSLPHQVFFFFFLKSRAPKSGSDGSKENKGKGRRTREGRKEGEIQWERREHDMKTKWGLSCPWGLMWGVHWAEVETKEECEKKKKKNCLRKEGARGKMRINAVTERWHNFASSALEDVRSAGAQLCWPTSCWAVWVAAALHLCRFRPEKPEDIQAYSKRVPAKGKMGCHLSPKSLVLFQLPARLELSEKSELIVTLWVAFRVGLKKMTTWVFLGGFYSCWTGNQRGK